MKTQSYVSRLSLRRDKIENYSKFPFSLPVVQTLDYIDFHPKVTYFVGENGSGKSTLLEALAVSLGLNAEGGTKNFSFSTRRAEPILSEYLRVAKGIRRPKDQYFLRAESFYNVATEIERLDDDPLGGSKIIDSYGGRSLHELSHGESFLTLLLEKFRGNSLYILDEPEAALSPQRQLSALSRIHDLVLQGSQFVIATHSPILLSYPDAQIYQCGEDGIGPVTYEETETVMVMKDFMANPGRMLNVLLER